MQLLWFWRIITVFNIVSDCDKTLWCKHDVHSVSMHVVMVTSSMLLKCAAIKQSTAGHRILAMFNIVRNKCKQMFEINLQAARIVVLRRAYAHTSRHSRFFGKCFWQVNIFKQLVHVLVRSRCDYSAPSDRCKSFTWLIYFLTVILNCLWSVIDLSSLPWCTFTCFGPIQILWF